MQGRRNPGGKGVTTPHPFQVLADILTLIQSRGADCAHHITNQPPPDFQVFPRPEMYVLLRQSDKQYEAHS